MKLYILYGLGQVALESHLRSIKKKFDKLSIVEINGKLKDLQSCLTEISTPNLFGSNRLVIFENFDEKIDLSKLPQDDDLMIVIKYLRNLPAQSKVLTEAKKIGAKIYQFNEEKESTIFPFLDLLTIKDPKALLLLDFLYKENGTQYLITMIFYMLRRLIVPPKKAYPQTVKILDKGKDNFNHNKLTEIYEKVLNLDFGIKSGLVDDKRGLEHLVIKIIA